VIEILSSPALNTVQDLGRFGLRNHGVSTSGAMDPVALAAGNILLGNEEGAAAIEVQTFPFRVRFLADLGFAVTGADSAARLGEMALPPWWAGSACRGQLLTLDTPRQGARAYVMLPGGVDVPQVLGSRSTHLRGGFGGFAGRPLQPGDVLGAGRTEIVRAVGAVPPDCALEPVVAQEPGCLGLRVLRAGDYDLFPPDAQHRFWDTCWRISPQSDRGGYRLSGPPLALERPVEMRSYGLVPGIVQVPPAGEPIIQLSDANTAGGYPKIATVIEADLWRLGQARLGSRIRFVEVAYAEAVAAMQPVRAYLDRLARLAALHRSRSAPLH